MHWRRKWQATGVACLEDPKDRGAWWAAVSGVAQSWTRLSNFTTERLHFHFSLSCIGEGNGNPLQCSCLENPRDRGAWWAAVYGVAQSRTQLKPLSSSSRLLSPWNFPGKNTGSGCHFLLQGIGNGNPLQCSCLENPRDGGPWWAAVYGVTQSWTRLKRLSSVLLMEL